MRSYIKYIITQRRSIFIEIKIMIERLRSLQTQFAIISRLYLQGNEGDCRRAGDVIRMGSRGEKSKTSWLLVY